MSYWEDIHPANVIRARKCGDVGSLWARQLWLCLETDSETLHWTLRTCGQET